MKGILKVRNFDSVKKLSLKRALGKQKSLHHRMGAIRTTILCLDTHGMLDTDKLWDLLKIYLNYSIESAKLQFVIYYRRGHLHWTKDFSESSMQNYYRNVNVSSHSMVSNIPYEISAKYRNAIYKKQKENETNN